MDWAIRNAELWIYATMSVAKTKLPVIVFMTAMVSVSACASELTNKLCRAAAGGDVEAIKSLVSAGANPNSHDIEGQTPLVFAVDHNHPEAVKLLIVLGADVNLTSAPGHSPLYWTTVSGCYECAVELVEHGAKMTTSASQEHLLKNLSQFPRLEEFLRKSDLLP